MSRVGGLRIGAPGAGRRPPAGGPGARRRPRRVRGRARVGGRRRRCATSWTASGVHDLDRTVDGLSGGEKRRVALATALVGDLDLVVLDEPTNHLDVEGIGWLAEHLVARRCAVVVVTHDRWFLDTVCTRTWEVAGGRVEGYLRRLRRLGVRPGRARAAGRRRRGPSAEPRPQGAGLAAARSARAHVQAAVPHRGGRGADRRRAAAARQGGAARLRHQPARPHRAGAGGRHASRSAGGRCSTASRGGSGQATGSGSSGSTARARPPCCTRSPGSGRSTAAGSCAGSTVQLAEL